MFINFSYYLVIIIFYIILGYIIYDNTYRVYIIIIIVQLDNFILYNDYNNMKKQNDDMKKQNDDMKMQNDDTMNQKIERVRKIEDGNLIKKQKICMQKLETFNKLIDLDNNDLNYCNAILEHDNINLEIDNKYLEKKNKILLYQIQELSAELIRSSLIIKNLEERVPLNLNCRKMKKISSNLF